MKEAEVRRYDRDEVISFRSTGEAFGGLSNMAPGFPVWVGGARVRTSEALYQACRFPHRPDIQRIILAERSPMTAKMRTKPFRHETRGDWEGARVPIMRWCLRVKLACNSQTFGTLLANTGSQVIVEDSRRDAFWGAVKQADGTLVGCNVLGRLLMELRQRWLADPEGARSVKPPRLHDFLLLGRRIEIVEAPADVAASGAPVEGAVLL